MATLPNQQPSNGSIKTTRCLPIAGAGTPSDQATCLSASYHGPERIRDHLRHYFGCIKIVDRVNYFEVDNEIWKYEHGLECEYLESLPEYKGKTEKIKQEAEKRVKKKIQSVAVAIEGHYRRTRILRQALLKDPNPESVSEHTNNSNIAAGGGKEEDTKRQNRSHYLCCIPSTSFQSLEGTAPTPLLPAGDTNNNENNDYTKKNCGHLVHQIQKSGSEWRKSDEYNKAIEKVRKWNLAKSNAKRNSEGNPEGNAEGNPEVNAEGNPDGNAEGNQEDNPVVQLPTTGTSVIQGDQTNMNFEEELNIIRRLVQEARNNQEPLVDLKKKGYILERDFNAYLIQYTRQDSRQSTLDPAIGSSSKGKEPDCLTNNGSSNAHFEPVDEELTDWRFKGRFPDQRIGMDLLLGLKEDAPGESAQSDPDNALPKVQSEERKELANSRFKKMSPDPAASGEHTKSNYGNVLSKTECEERDETRLRYFHIPSNNMDWIEKAIARYYGEKQPALSNTSRDPLVKTRTQMILRPQFWRGQQHGARSGIVHARHMRPLCERISSDVNEIEDNPKNIVLFMPYLHWDTDRMRNKISNMIDNESEKQRRWHEEINTKKRQARKEEREGLDKPGKQIEHPPEDKNLKLRMLAEKNGRLGGVMDSKDLDGISTQIMPVGPNGKDIKIDRNGRLQIHNKLGQYLIDAARLYEAMSTYRDQKMLEKYLYHDPPLHPRRTLDQSYYWTLRTTKVRDRDQVVYRGTSINLDSCHRLIVPKSDKEEKTSRFGSFSFTSKTTANTTEDKEKLLWSWHSDKTDKNGCDHCRNDIRRTSQVVMVDQLWMWVLDEKTIITSFPRRYGFNKQDLSGVHKSIRARLQSARKNQIRSIYDLALIVLDECSNTFFDRTKTEDSQPRVMDIFSEAIGKVTNQHTISFQHVWHWTEKASTIYRSKSKYIDSSDLHVPLLDINPEGKLQREVKDIIDEIDIMINVHKKQREVIRRFCKHVERILDPEGQWPDGGDNNDGQPKTSLNTENNTPSEAEKKERRDKLCWFRLQSHELLAEVDDRLDELEGLKNGAESTARSVNDLLSLKQQQASVVQAWESVKQAEEAVRQGRAIMMFTVMTIIFLPMSFISSVFGMNNREFGGPENPWSVKDQLLLYLLPISLVVITLSVTIAFSNMLRAILYSLFILVKTWLTVKLKIYWIWLSVREDFCSISIMRWTEERVRKMKEAVEIQKRRENRTKKEEESKKKKEQTEDANGDENMAGRGGKRKGRFWRRKVKKQGNGGGGTPSIRNPGQQRQEQQQQQQQPNGSHPNRGNGNRSQRQRSSLDKGKNGAGNGSLGVVNSLDPSASGISGLTTVAPSASHHSYANSGNGDGNGRLMGSDENV